MDPNLAAFREDRGELKRDVASLIEHIRGEATSRLQNAAGQIDRAGKERHFLRRAVKIASSTSAKMKIAQIAPLMESVPPRLYGGTERVVSHLCEALVQEGHDVTLFASGDSVTSARLVACTKEAIRLNAAIQDCVPHYMIMLDKVRRSSHLFDILHFHIDAFHMPLFRDVGAKTLTTLHGRQDPPDLLPLYRAFPDMPLVSVQMRSANRSPKQISRRRSITDCRSIFWRRPMRPAADIWPFSVAFLPKNALIERSPSPTRWVCR
jgi:Glycosyltransferase Family 4